MTSGNATNDRKLPIGIQSFERLRNERFVYIDKTALIYELVHTSTPYFLSRPRRFGKSLLLSTLLAYWEGKRELFEGLAIEQLEENNDGAWRSYPVFYFDFNKSAFQEPGSLETVLEEHLKQWEALYKLSDVPGTLAARFQKLLVRAYEQTGQHCVVLVDEYDKPLLEAMDNKALIEHNQQVFKGFFSTLKSYDAYLQFVFITGVTKFNKVSIFSDLNQLRDISMSRKYSSICGITESEMIENLNTEIKELAVWQHISDSDCLDTLRSIYDGYRFHSDGERVYNPFSLLNALDDKDFRAYWFATGTPTFLVKYLRKIEFDVRKFTDGTLYASEAMLTDYRVDNPDPIPLLYQTGYLTITGYSSKGRRYTLGFPNEEVKYGFLENLMPEYAPTANSGNGLDIFTLGSLIEAGDTDGIRDVLIALFAGIQYTDDDKPFEHYFQTVIYLVFTLLGKLTTCEMHTWKGRIDCLVEAEQYIYLFEFKRDSSAEKALCQIEEMEYAKKYAADPRKLFQVGVNFDSGKRMLTEWKVRE